MTQELRKLAEAATQGPWIAGDDEDSDYYLVGPPSFDRVVTNPVVQLHALNNAEFIAAANPAAILALLDRVEKAEKDAERGRYMINNGCWHRGEEQTHLAVLVPQGSDLSCYATRSAAIDAAMEASK